MITPSEQSQQRAEQIPLPQGWTELIHGTDSLRWGVNDHIKHISANNLSAIEAGEVARERQMMAQNPYISEGAYDTTRHYAAATSTGAVPTEVRIIAPCPEFAYGRGRHISAELQDMYAAFTQAQKELLPKYYPARHPVVPAGENIIKIAEHEDDVSGRKVLTYVPESFAEAYAASLETANETAAAGMVREQVVEAEKYIADFNKEVDIQKNLLQQGKTRLDAAAQRLEAAKQSPNVAMVGVRTANHATLQRRQRTLIKETRLLRPSSLEDTAYRLQILHELPGAIEEALPSNSLLRFHATSLLATEEILQTGELSSAVDRTGQPASYDAADQVSVTTPDDVSVSVRGYLGLVERRQCLPAGCMFVLLPKDASEAAAGNQMLMDNVYFRDRPEQFVGILTSDENVPTVRAWCVKAGMDPGRVQEFFTGVEHLKTAFGTADKTS